MKKVLAFVLALVFAMGTLSACGAPAETTTAETTTAETTTGETTKETVDIGIDMSAYPADLQEWSEQNYLDYFKAAGVFYDGNGAETWVQDHANYWMETPVSYCVGWWNDEGTAMFMVMKLAVQADADESVYKEWTENIKAKKALPGDYAQFTVDHMVGDMIFIYGDFTLDDEVYEKMDKAYNDLVKALGLAAEF